jgi:uncharacterized protein YkwD
VLAAFLALTGTAAAAPASTGAMLASINAARAAHGLEALTADPALAAVAQGHAGAMATRRYFLHRSGPRGAGFRRRVGRAAGAPGGRLGEVLARGTGALGAPRAIVQAWLASPTHRAVILSEAFTRVGIGVSVDAGGVVLWTADLRS